MKEKIRNILGINGIPASPDLPEKLEIYLRLLKEWNSKMDLIADAPDDEILDRHFTDSLTVLRNGLVPYGAKWIDVGTGAGFPGLPLAMARPDIMMTLMDAQQKRLNFLQAVIEETGISNCCTVHMRAEEGARNPEYREKFDIASARAVAPLNTLTEYLLPFVRIGGAALCWKGPALRNELEAGRRSAHILGGKLEMPVICHIEGRDWEHMVLPIRKTEKTAAAYPRKAGMPKTKPLVKQEAE
jgi:16S rRNA (guanine527-N7)-methyltransferase